MKNKCICTALIYVVTSVSVLSGQGTQINQTPPTTAQNVARLVARLTTLLSLSSDQQAKATTYFTTEQNAVSALMTSMKAAQTALQTAIEKDDTETISSEASQIGALTAQETQARATAQAEFYAILTSDQQVKYQQLLENPGGLGGGPGGPGRPGPR